MGWIGGRYTTSNPMAATAGNRRALAAGVTDLALFVAATESFSRANINRSIAQSLELIARRPVGFSVLTGEDALFFPLLCSGMDGGILAAAHLATERFVQVAQLVAAAVPEAGFRCAAALAPQTAVEPACPVVEGEGDDDEVDEPTSPPP